MSAPAVKRERDNSGNNDNLPVPYEVGYGKPPAEHRFQKGRSGNPGGRPRGAKNRPRQFDPAAQPTDSLILQEAYRPVTIREGDKVIELPAIQAAAVTKDKRQRAKMAQMDPSKASRAVASSSTYTINCESCGRDFVFSQRREYSVLDLSLS